MILDYDSFDLNDCRDLTVEKVIFCRYFLHLNDSQDLTMEKNYFF